MNCVHNSNILYLLSLTGPPSSPRSPVPQVNDTSLTLEWSEPLDCGGRSDLTYSVECRMCSTPRGPCMPCGDGVNYRPSQTGIQGRRLSVWGLRPHTTYSFTVMALNGVSPLSQQGHVGETVNITTSPNGETERQWRFIWMKVVVLVECVNCLCVCFVVPVLVSGLRKVTATESSLTLHWNTPTQSHYRILQYQLRYCEKVNDYTI